MRKSIGDALRGFIRNNFLFDENAGIADDSSLLENGVIDSTGVLELVTFIEATFGIKVADEEIVPENLDSVANLTGYIHRKLSLLAASEATALLTAEQGVRG
jgi:acyl carrier protein